MSAFDAAVTLAKASGWSLSNLELQKLLYISQMIYMGRTGGEPIFDEDFEAWKLGPVVPSVYRSAKLYGSGPVVNLFHRGELLDGPKKSVVEETYASMRGKKPMELVSITHWSRGAWAKHYKNAVQGVRIPKSDILIEYRDRGLTKN